MIQKLSSNREVIFHPTSKGDASEINWIEWLKTYLPKRYEVDKAFVIDSNNRFSEQLDLVIYDRQYSPFVFYQDGAIYIPAESVYAVFEIKQELNKTNFLYAATPVQNKFLTALAKIGSTSYLPFTTTKPKAYVKNNSTCPNDSTVASRKVQKIGK